ncbi:MAG: diguanylate cyclase [Ectothiorhodospiraceae bacterium]
MDQDGKPAAAALNASYRELLGEVRLLRNHREDCPIEELEPRLIASIQEVFVSSVPGEVIERPGPGNSGLVGWERHTLAPATVPGEDEAGVLDLAVRIPPTAPIHEDPAYRDAVLGAMWRTTPDAVIVTDFTRALRVCNQQFCDLWGVTERFVREADIDELLDYVTGQMRDGDAIAAEVRAMRESPDEFRDRWDLELLDGRLIESHSQPLVGPNMMQWGRIWFLRDVTLRKRVSDALEESERHFRQLAEGANQGIVIQRLDRDGTILYMNEAAAGMVDRDPLEVWPPSPDRLPVDIEAIRKAAPAPMRALSDSRRESLRCTLPTRRSVYGVEWLEVFVNRIDWRGEPAVQLSWVDVTAYKRLEHQLAAEADTDPLTGLFNRRAFHRKAQSHFHSARAGDTELTLLVIDIDHFKQVNDTAGHQAGDAVLRHLARSMQDSFRELDVLARLGGDEFAVLMPGADLDTALKAAERVNRLLGEGAERLSEWNTKFSISIGVAEKTPADHSPRALEERADRALYAAKAAGRNRIFADTADGPDEARGR